MADYGGGTAVGGGVNVGSLVVNLTMNTDGVEKGLAAIKKDTASAAAIIAKEWNAAGGALGKFGSSINEIRESTIKMFGDKAPAAMQRFGKEMGAALGMGSEKVKGLESAVGALGGAFKVAGTAIGMLATPLGLIVGMLGGAVLAVHAIVKASGGKINQRGGSWFEERAKDFRAGLTGLAGLAGNEAAAKQSYWEIQPEEVQRKTLEKYNALAAKDSLSIIEGEWMASIRSRIPASVLSGATSPDESPLAKADKWLRDMEAKVAKLMTPGTTAADTEKSAAEKLKHQMAVAESGQKEMASAMVAQQAAEEKRQDEIGEASAALHQAELDSIQMQKDQAEDLKNEQIAQTALIADSYRGAAEVTTKMLADAEADIRNRWQALGSGQLGTAAGVGGIGGMALNMLGGKAAESPLTGKVLQGASQGGEAGGIWGAIIGAILALLGETRTFGKIMSMIEGLLGDILPVLDELLEPIVQILEPLFEALDPILSVLADVLGVIGDVLMDLVGQVQNLVDSDLGAGYSFKDYTTPSGWISMIADEVKKGEKSKEEKAKLEAAGATYIAKNMDPSGYTRLGMMKKDYGSWNDTEVTSQGDSSQVLKFKDDWNAAAAIAIATAKEEARARAEAERLFEEATGGTLVAFETAGRKIDFFTSAMDGLKNSTEQASFSLDLMSDAKWLDAYEGNYMKAREAQDKKKAIDDQLEKDYRALHPELYALAEAAGAAADATNSLSEALTNVPVGYKLKAQQYAATGDDGQSATSISGPFGSDAPTSWGGTGGNGGGGGGKGGRGVTIYVDGSKDPAEVAKQVKLILDRDNFLSTGSMVPIGPKF